MKKIIFPIFLFFTIISVAQNDKLKTANSEYENLAYMDAVKIYENVVAKGYGTPEMYLNLGNSYYFNADYKNASKWYGKLFEDSFSSLDSEYYYRYYQSLKGSGETAKADSYLQKFSKLVPNDPRSLNPSKGKDYLQTIDKYSGRYLIENSGGNSNFSDYGPAFYKDGIVFTSSRGKGTIHPWTNQPYSTLYFAKRSINGNLDKAEKFSKKIESKLNESTAVFTKDGKTMYFTRNNTENAKKVEGFLFLKLYSASLSEKGEWGNIQELPFNSSKYSCAHPALSPDEKTLYFASNMPGTFGGSDIYKVSILGNNTYGKPENLGSVINTPGRETFPFVSSDNELYFASDGHLGFGGLDVFGVKIEGENTYSKIYNLGKPLNSNQDDFAYIIDSKTSLGYYSSNKPGGTGFDDIYKFKETSKLPFGCKQKLEGRVIDSKTKEIIPNAVVTLLDQNMAVIDTISVDSQGFYSIEVNCGTNYYVRVSAPQYDSNEINVTTPSESGVTKVGDITLTKRFIPIKEGGDLAKTYDINNIYFDLNKSVITKKAEEKLVTLLSILEAYPQIKVDIRSHTDSRGSDKYNLKLSDLRAKATLKWLVEKGINKKRLTGKGYGETRLKNNCSDAVKCSEEEHAVNRRSEFIIVK